MVKHIAIFAVLTYFASDSCCLPYDNKSEAEAAVALAKAKNCTCSDNLDACREEAKKTGKPLVLSVNTGCEGFSKALPWAIFCKVKSYEGDITPTETTIKSDTARFVILSVDSKNDKLYIRKSVSNKLTLTEFKTILLKETKVRLSKALLTWE